MKKVIEKIKDIDLQFFHKLRTYSVSQKTDIFLRLYIHLGDGYIWAMVIAYLIFFEGFEKFSVIIKAVAPAGFFSLAVYWIIKYLVKRKRPYDLLSGVNAKISPLDRYSFPSGHTMNNLTLGFTLSYFMPQIGGAIMILFILMPLSWGLLRVYYGLHWLSDILAGIVLAGLCLSLYFTYFFKLGCSLFPL